MLAFLAKYWLEFSFGIIATGATALAKYFYNLYKKEKVIQLKEQKKEILNETRTLLEQQHSQLNDKDQLIITQLNQIGETVEILKSGMLSIQGKQFKQECKDLLHSDHKITTDEWLRVNQEHDIYKSLNGNHEGDLLFKDVEMKYHSK